MTQIPEDGPPGIFSDQNDSGHAGRPDQPKTAETVQAWLVRNLAKKLKLEPDEIDVRKPFSYYGLGSAEAIMLSCELEDWLGCELSPTLAWDYSTIEALARYLADES